MENSKCGGTPKKVRDRLPVSYFLAFMSEWTPGLPFLVSKRFWVWTLSVFSISIASLFIGMTRLSDRDVDWMALFLMAFLITIPCQIIGMAIQYLMARRRREPRGFRVISDESWDTSGDDDEL